MFRPLFYILLLLCSPAFSQTLRLEITGYDARCVFPDENASFAVHLDKNGVQQGPFTVYELMRSAEKKDSVIVFRGTILDGRFVDSAAWYYSNGAVLRTAFFSREKPADWRETSCWFDAGNLNICGKLEGAVVEWYDIENGKQTFRKKYNYSGGKENGLQQRFYSSGRLFQEYEATNGQRNGRYTYWYENGQIREEGVYKKDEVEGQWKYYRKDGTLNYTHAFHGGNDTLCTYYADGQLHDITVLKNYEPFGDYKEFYPQGNLKTYRYFKNGSQDSIEIVYHENGAKAEQLLISDGYANGKYQSWHPNGKLQSTGSYFLGYKKGAWKEYDANGKLTGTRNYPGNTDFRDVRLMLGEGSDVVMDQMPAFDLKFQVPKMKDGEQAFPVLPEDKMKFLKKYTFIDAQAVMDSNGNVTWCIITPLKPAEQEKLVNYLQRHWPGGRAMYVGVFFARHTVYDQCAH